MSPRVCLYVLLLLPRSDTGRPSVFDLDAFPPTAEEAAWVDENLNAILIPAATTYPVPAVRLQLLRLIVFTRASGLHMNITRRPHPSGRSVVASALWTRDNVPTILWHLPGVRDVYREVGQNRARYEDEIIAIYLHEFYHLSVQNLHRPNLSYEEMVELELEAWWWTVEQVIIPMKVAGRFPGDLSPLEQAVITAHMFSYGDVHSPYWHAMGDVLTPYVAPKP